MAYTSTADISKIISEYHRAVNLRGKKRLMDISKTLVNEAQKNFDAHEIEITGIDSEIKTNVYKVDVSDKQTTIIAQGQEVAFIEFGTGVYNPEYGGLDYISKSWEGVIMRGSYGKHYGRRKAWGYYAKGGEKKNDRDYFYTRKKSGKTVVITYGMKPARAMFNAIKTMEKEFEKKI